MIHAETYILEIREQFYLKHIGGLGRDSNSWTTDPLAAIRFPKNFDFKNLTASVRDENPKLVRLIVDYNVEDL